MAASDEAAADRVRSTAVVAAADDDDGGWLIDGVNAEAVRSYAVRANKTARAEAGTFMALLYIIYLIKYCFYGLNADRRVGEG